MHYNLRKMSVIPILRRRSIIQRVSSSPGNFISGLNSVRIKSSIWGNQSNGRLPRAREWGLESTWLPRGCCQFHVDPSWGSTLMHGGESPGRGLWLLVSAWARGHHHLLTPQPASQRHESFIHMPPDGPTRLDVDRGACHSRGCVVLVRCLACEWRPPASGLSLSLSSVLPFKSYCAMLEVTRASG